MKNQDFSDLLKSIDQARAIHAGKLQTARVVRFDSVTVRNIRKKFNQSQAEFAYIIGVSINTLQNWEQGRRSPEGPAQALLRVAERNPEVVMRALHK